LKSSLYEQFCLFNASHSINLPQPDTSSSISSSIL
jgi:hypothetical protein